MAEFKKIAKPYQTASFLQAARVLVASLKSAAKITPMKPAPIAFLIKKALRVTLILLQEILLYSLFSFSKTIRRFKPAMIHTHQASAPKPVQASLPSRHRKVRAVGMRPLNVLALVILFVFGLGFSMQTVLAFESHMVDIRAHVENALGISTYSLDFGTVFPEESLTKQINIGLSQSFRDQEVYSTVEYSVYWEPKPIEGDAADPDNDGYFEPIYPFISLHAEDDVVFNPYKAGPSGTIWAGTGKLSLPEDQCDMWQIVLDPPVFDEWYNELTDPREPSGVLKGDQYYTTEETAACGFKALVPHADLGSNLTIQVTAIDGNGDGTITDGELPITGGENTHTPVILCKWEQQNLTSPPETPNDDSTQGYGNLESGDTEHQTNGTQVLPPVRQDGKTYIQYWAIITDPYGVEKVANAVVDVYYPSGLPYNGSHKSRFDLEKVSLEDGLAVYEAARDAGLVTYQTNWAPEGQAPPLDDGGILYSINSGSCSIWMVTGELENADPAGDYRAVFDAVDINGSWASQKIPETNLSNMFTYVAVAAIEIDFTSFSYGEITIDQQNQGQWLLGDTDWNSPADSSPIPNPATIRNIGNVPVHITIMNNDMDLGYNGEQGTNYSGSTLPNAEQSNWNAVYGARLSSSLANIVFYDPGVTAVLLRQLSLAQTDGLDLFMLVKQALPGAYNGDMTISCTQAPWN
jgi:hypothetical protein